jgi:hypothetical protein
MVEAPPLDGHLSLSVTTYARLWERLKKGPHKPKDVGEILALIAKDAPEYQGPEAEGETRGPIGPKGRLSPNERGTLFHAVMEESDCSFEPGRYQSELKKKAKALNLCPTEEELRFLAEKAMEFQECEIGRLLRKAHEQKLPVFHEWTVWYLLEKDEYGFGPVYLNGSIDLFFLDAQGKGYLVDYKIARESHEPRYKRQLELYAMAIRESGIAQELTTILWYPKP